MPVTGFILAHFISYAPLSFENFGKWFVFSAAGLRLFLAASGKQPNMHLQQEIFHIDSTDCFPIVRELGFANLCFGLLGILYLFIPAWHVASAFASGLYFGLAALQHFIKKRVGTNEQFA